MYEHFSPEVFHKIFIAVFTVVSHSITFNCTLAAIRKL